MHNYITSYSLPNFYKVALISFVRYFHILEAFKYKDTYYRLKEHSCICISLSLPLNYIFL